MLAVHVSSSCRRFCKAFACFSFCVSLHVMRTSSSSTHFHVATGQKAERGSSPRCCATSARPARKLLDDVDMLTHAHNARCERLQAVLDAGQAKPYPTQRRTHPGPCIWHSNLTTLQFLVWRLPVEIDTSSAGSYR